MTAPTSKSLDRRSLPLTPAEWAALERIAEESGSIAPTGPQYGKPSWRTLIKRIAIGELLVKKEE